MRHSRYGVAYRFSFRIWQAFLQDVPSSSEFKDNFTEMCSGSEEGSYLRPIDFSITQL